MRMRLPLAVALLTSLLAGCTAIGDDAGPAVGSAADWQPPADRAAHKWADDAVLVTADATEFDDRARAEFADELSDAREEYEEERAEAQADAKEDGDDSEMEEFEEQADTVERFFDLAQRVVDTPDPQVGDGRASVWSFTYTAASMPGDGYFVAVARGRVAFQDSDEGLGWDEYDSDDEPLGNWSIDSDDAADAAALGDADYARLRDGRNVVSHAYLMQGGDGPLWSIGIQTDEDTGDDEDSAYLAVDATDGSIVKDETIVIEPDVDIVAQELGRSQGSFIASIGTSQALSFDVLDGRHLEFAIEASVSPAPAQPITATLTDPLGGQTVLDLSMGQNPSRAAASAVLGVVPNGTYSLEFQVPLSAYSSWRMSWCTDGTPEDYEDALAVPACQLLPQSGGDGSGGETLSGPFRWARAWQR